MDFYKQVENWVNQKKWTKIIRAIEKIKPEGRTEDLAFILASAYLQVAHGWEDRKISKKALDILLSLSPVLKQNVMWYLTVGHALQNLERFAEASQYYQEGLEFTDEEEHQKILLALHEKNRDLDDPTAFTESFSVRVSKVWEEFVKREAEFRNIFDKDTDRKRWREVCEKLSVVFEIALDDVTVFMSKRSDKYQLAMSGGGDLLRLFEELYVKSRAPASVLEKWEIVIGAPSKVYDDVEAEKSNNHLDDLQLWFHKDDYELLEVEGYSKTLWEPPADENGKVINDAYLSGYVLFLVGEAAYSKYIESVKTVTEPLEEKSIGAKEVPEYFASLGIDLDAGTEAIIEKMVPYEGEIQDFEDVDKDELESREDVIEGASMATKAIYDFMHCEFGMFYKLAADGAVVCTLYFDNESFAGEDREEKILKYRQSVEHEILEKSGSESVKIIGYAHGKYWEYIDMIAWNPKKVFETADEIAKNSPAKNVVLQVLGIYAAKHFLKEEFPRGSLAASEGTKLDGSFLNQPEKLKNEKL